MLLNKPGMSTVRLSLTHLKKSFVHSAFIDSFIQQSVRHYVLSHKVKQNSQNVCSQIAYGSYLEMETKKFLNHINIKHNSTLKSILGKKIKPDMVIEGERGAILDKRIRKGLIEKRCL